MFDNQNSISRRRFLRGATVGSASLGLGVSLTGTSQAMSSPRTPRVITPEDATSNRVFLAVDETLHERLDGTELALAQAEPQGEVIKIDQEWEREVGKPDRTGYASSIIVDHDGLFRLYYELIYHNGRLRRGAVAFSHDGVHWEKPEMDLAADSLGVDNTNLLRVTGVEGASSPHTFVCTPCVFMDHEAADSERYKMLFWTHIAGEGRTLCTAVSEDGFDFQMSARIPPGHQDTINVGLRDPATAEYRVYSRRWFARPPGSEERPPSRGVAWTRSDSWGGDWPEREDLLDPQEFDPTSWADIYTPGIFPYAGQYIALPGVWYREPADGDSGYPGPIYPTLLHGHDGEHWRAPDYWHSMLDLGGHGFTENPEDFGMAFPAPGVLDHNGKLFVYYQYWTGQHSAPGSERTASIHYATLRRDGFGAITDSSGTGGTWTTPVIRVPGDAEQLYVNTDARGGLVRVELLHPHVDEPIRGFEAHQPIAGDHLEAEAWRGERVRSVQNRDVRVRFEIRNASVYSFWFDLRDHPGRGAVRS